MFVIVTKHVCKKTIIILQIQIIFQQHQQYNIFIDIFFC